MTIKQSAADNARLSLFLSLMILTPATQVKAWPWDKSTTQPATGGQPDRGGDGGSLPGAPGGKGGESGASDSLARGTPSAPQNTGPSQPSSGQPTKINEALRQYCIKVLSNPHKPPASHEFMPTDCIAIFAAIPDPPATANNSQRHGVDGADGPSIAGGVGGKGGKGGSGAGGGAGGAGGAGVAGGKGGAGGAGGAAD